MKESFCIAGRHLQHEYAQLLQCTDIREGRLRADHGHYMVCRQSEMSAATEVRAWVMRAVFVQEATTNRMRGVAERDVKTAQGLTLQPGHTQHGTTHFPAGLRVWLRATVHVQEATMNRTGGEALSGMSNGRRASRNSLDTRNMAQFISLQPSRGIDYDKAAEEVLAKVRIVMALRVGQLWQPAASRTCWTATWRLHQDSCHCMMKSECILRARDAH